MSDSDSSENSLQEDDGLKPYMFEPKRTREKREEKRRKKDNSSFINQ